LLQIAGRTARNVDGLVILYADRITNSIKSFVDETNRRRKIQLEYNKQHNINPQTVYKTLDEILSSTSIADIQQARQSRKLEKYSHQNSFAEPLTYFLNEKQKEELIEQLFKEMKEAARNLDFERAAEIRDEINKLKGENNFFGKTKKKLLN
jgi:excinuclease ABC subunit B